MNTDYKSVLNNHRGNREIHKAQIIRFKIEALINKNSKSVLNNYREHKVHRVKRRHFEICVIRKILVICVKKSY